LNPGADATGLLSPTCSILETLIGFDTVSRNSNLGLIEWTRDWLASLGVTSTLTYDARGGKANLLATLGDPAQREGGIVLCGHTDVVPVDGQDWHSDPFRAQWFDDRVHGRGTCDMKGFIACVLAIAPRFVQSRLRQPVHIALTFDEEVGCLGAPLLVDDMLRLGYRPQGCIIGEPTSMQLMTGHKGVRIYECAVRGCEAHSSLAPQAVNAIEYAAQLIVRVRETADALRHHGPFDHGYDIPYATLSTGVILGGTAANIVPRDCRFQFDLRYLPAMDPDVPIAEIRKHAADLTQRMQVQHIESGFCIEQVAESPALETPADSRIIDLVQRIMGTREAGRVAFATDGGHFHKAGIPTVVIGPGSIEQAHKPDEFVSRGQLHSCLRFLEGLRGSILESVA
jgi:acetylornithine deacetylase